MIIERYTIETDVGLSFLSIMVSRHTGDWKFLFSYDGEVDPFWTEPDDPEAVESLYDFVLRMAAGTVPIARGIPNEVLKSEGFLTMKLTERKDWPDVLEKIAEKLGKYCRVTHTVISDAVLIKE